MQDLMVESGIVKQKVPYTQIVNPDVRREGSPNDQAMSERGRRDRIRGEGLSYTYLTRSRRDARDQEPYARRARR